MIPNEATEMLTINNIRSTGTSEMIETGGGSTSPNGGGASDAKKNNAADSGTEKFETYKIFFAIAMVLVVILIVLWLLSRHKANDGNANQVILQEI